MKKVSYITRTIKNQNGTFGIFRYTSLKWFTVERPWINNKNNVSCIPKGTYLCKWTKSPRLKKYTYEVQNVPNRAGIRIHAANWPQQVLGCIALGLTTGIVKGIRGIFNSQTAVRNFETALNYENFELEIK